MSIISNLRVLIVEDNIPDIAINRALLESCGINPTLISQASTVAEAKTILDIHPPHICIIDYVLPDGDGTEVLQYIQMHNTKTENIQTPVSSIVVTGSGREKLVAEFFRNGANDYIVKSEVIDKLIPSIIRVVTERLSSIASRERNLFDNVTGVLNRASFLEYASNLLDECHQKKQLCALIYIDLDSFKKVNDTLGHLAGDQYLKAAAKRLLHIGRNTDLVARMGGDEFVVLLGDISRCDLIIKIDQWMKENETYYDKGFAGHRLRCSVGITVTDPKKVMTLEQLISDADQAMYSAKKSGKDRYAFVGASRMQNQQPLESFPSQHNAHHRPPTSILNALCNQELSIFFQPIRDLNTMNIQFLEVLVRWANKPHNLNISDIFSVFAEFDLYDQFHSWLMPALLDCISDWQQEGCDIKFSINAPTSIQGCRSFIRFLEAGLANKNQVSIKTRFLIVEVNESLFNQDVHYFSQFLSQLSAMGIAACLDQFSKMETKIVTLVAQKFSSVKVRRCDFDEDYLKVLRLSSFLRACMECDLIAVGVESKDELEQLQSIDVDKVQGHYLGEPKAACGHWQDFISQFEPLDAIAKK